MIDFFLPFFLPLHDSATFSNLSSTSHLAHFQPIDIFIDLPPSILKTQIGLAHPISSLSFQPTYHLHEFQPTPQFADMSHEEDLIDYSEEEIDTTDNAAGTTGTGQSANGETKKGDLTVTGAAADKTKGSYVGIHSTGFRDFLLKPELLRAITDCGFEHPSEG